MGFPLKLAGSCATLLATAATGLACSKHAHMATCHTPWLPRAAGLDGCSDTPVAVLKTAAPYPDNSYVSPHISTLVCAAWLLYRF